VAAALGACWASPALAVDAEVEGETMTLAPAYGLAMYDAKAKHGNFNALQIWANNGDATKTVNMSQAATHLLVRARGDDCLGAPTILVKVDGQTRYDGPVSIGDYQSIGVRLSIPAGSHAIAIRLTNDYSVTVGGVKVCDRNAWIDTVRLVGQPFSATGWRNTPLPAVTTTTPNSAAMADDLRRQIMTTPPPDAGVWVNHDKYTSPTYVVGEEHPVVKVTPDRDFPALAAQWEAVPLPPDVRPSDGNDKTAVIWQPETDRIWEFMGLRRDENDNTKWIAHHGGRMDNVSSNEGTWPGHFGAAATSIGVLAGQQRIEELRRGVIDHPVTVALDRGQGRDGWCWPADRTDTDGPTRLDDAAIPAGTRFRFRSMLNLDTYPMHPYARVLARAIQRYGMVVSDHADVVAFGAEDYPRTGQPDENPYSSGPGAGGQGDPNHGIFGWEYPNRYQIFKDFPWHELEAVSLPLGKTCTDNPPG
jgi:hypothetical protein